MKLKENDYNDDEANSFLASPKQDIISFFNGSTNIHDSKNGPISDSTVITRGNRSKATSQYDIRCKICLKMFGSIDKYLGHQ